jgi:hypothetical protein
MKQYLYIAFGYFVVAAWALSVLLSGCAPKFESCWPGLDTCQIEDRVSGMQNVSCVLEKSDVII